jgi:polygalacturonase
VRGKGKFETRNSKFETSSKFEIRNLSLPSPSPRPPLLPLQRSFGFRILAFEFVSSFEFRISNLYLSLALPLLLLTTSSCWASENRFLITDHGAIADSKTLNTKAIQKTIDACAAAGGGTVVIPSGTFISGSVFLKQGVNLTIEKGGILKGSENTNDYPEIDTRIAGLEMKWPAALVNADGVSNVVLSGDGTIDGSGEPWWRRYWQMRRAEKEDIDPHFKVPRPRLVHFIRCEKMTVRDLLLKDSAFWNLQLTYCDGVEVHNLRIRAPHEPVKAASSDGIDLDSTRNALVEGCDIECDDDAICLKAGRDADGLRVNRPTENVVIRNCRVGHAAGLVCFGSETAGGIRNIRISNCRAENGCGEVVRFKTRMGRGGVVEDVVYENIQADGARAVFNFNMDAFATTWLPEQFRAPAPADKATPIFRNITVRNLTAKNCNAVGHMVGLSESPLRGVRFENVEVEARAPLVIRHAVDLEFKNVKVNGKLVEPPLEAMTPQDKEKVAARGAGGN